MKKFVILTNEKKVIVTQDGLKKYYDKINQFDIFVNIFSRQLFHKGKPIKYIKGIPYNYFTFLLEMHHYKLPVTYNAIFEAVYPDQNFNCPITKCNRVRRIIFTLRKKIRDLSIEITYVNGAYGLANAGKYCLIKLLIPKDRK